MNHFQALIILFKNMLFNFSHKTFFRVITFHSAETFRFSLQDCWVPWYSDVLYPSHSVWHWPEVPSFWWPWEWHIQPSRSPPLLQVWLWSKSPQLNCPPLILSTPWVCPTLPWWQSLCSRSLTRSCSLKVLCQMVLPVYSLFPLQSSGARLVCCGYKQGWNVKKVQG